MVTLPSPESGRKTIRKIRADMISQPQNDLRHTGHIGFDGAMFGDISFIGDAYDKLPTRMDGMSSIIFYFFLYLFCQPLLVSFKPLIIKSIQSVFLDRFLSSRHTLACFIENRSQMINMFYGINFKYLKIFFEVRL